VISGTTKTKAPCGGETLRNFDTTAPLLPTS